MLVPIKKPPTLQSVEEGLEYLCNYGEPRLSKFNRGWYACIEMFVSIKQASFKIDTSHEEKTPTTAINNLISSVHKVLADLGYDKRKLKGEG